MLLFIYLFIAKNYSSLDPSIHPLPENERIFNEPRVASLQISSPSKGMKLKLEEQREREKKRIKARESFRMDPVGFYGKLGGEGEGGIERY